MKLIVNGEILRPQGIRLDAHWGDDDFELFDLILISMDENMDMTYF